MTVHNNTDLYACLYCPLTFRHNSSYYAHRRMAHPEHYPNRRALPFVFACDSCDQV